MSLILSVNDLVSIRGTQYTVSGKIQYKDDSSYYWDEYKLVSNSNSYWLSVDEDDIFFWTMIQPVATDGMSVEEQGNEEVVSCSGDVDVAPGDRASYKEFNDGANIVAVETWSDMVEYSVGNQLSSSDVRLISGSSKSSVSSSSVNENVKKYGCLGVLLLLVGFFVCNNSDSTSLKSLVENDPTKYKLETAITGMENKTADVYKPDFTTTELIAKDLIDKLEGNVESVQENPQDESVIALLTSKEICVIYKNMNTGDPLMHLASREWTVDNLEAPLYAADSLTNDFYRSFYWYHGIGQDSVQYSASDGYHRHYHHCYGTYFSTFYLLNDSRYNSYSSSVREASAARRRSSGGGSGGGGK